MKRWVMGVLLCAACFATDVPSSPGSPVLVELFTSEGCSSCPPADAILGELDRAQPIPGAQVIVLSEHVDYWNHDGWRDPYSSEFFTDRQQQYARHFGLASPYTPQMVVDGAVQVGGSDGPMISKEIKKAEGARLVPIQLSVVSAEGNMVRVHVAADESGGQLQHKGDVYLALALNHAESQVAAGENKGRHLSHVAVVEAIKKIGTLDKGKSFQRDVDLHNEMKTEPGNLRVIAFVQEPGQGSVIGSAMRTVAK